MSKHYLNTLFSPSSVAVFGASNTENTMGQIVFSNLLENNYKGALYPINPKHEEVQNHPAYPSLRSIEGSPPIDLAVIITPAETVPLIIQSCGEYGIKRAIIISGGFHEVGKKGIKLEAAVVETAKQYGVRFIGPNCLGVISPRVNLNTTLIKGVVKPGRLALISQSGALCTAVLDWAIRYNMGFSTVVSMGTSADLDFGEILDYLVSDPYTHGILLYIEGIHHARSFMSGLRAAAQIKPVLLIKSGRHEASAKVVRSHRGVLVGRDDAFNAALERAGVIRVSTFGQLFPAATTLASRYRNPGNHLAIITNGNGPGIMAIDRAVDLNIPLAIPSRTTFELLTKEMPSHWAGNNPIDILGDATTERYEKTITICLQDANIDALLIILTPQVINNPLEIAEKLIQLAETSTKPLLACWIGGIQIRECERLFAKAAIPYFRTPEAAVEAFHYLSTYHRNQELLSQRPASLADFANLDVEGARIIIEGVLSERRKVLTEMESKAVLGAFHIPVVNTAIARTANEALVLAESMGFPVAMKINSHDISNKTEVGAVKLNLNNAHGVREAFKEIIRKVKVTYPFARIDGVTVESMVKAPHGRELRAGICFDSVFGPIITFGIGGALSEIAGDTVIGLPPLNQYLINTMIDKTRMAKALGEFHNMPAVKRSALENILLRVSEMACELPWIQELEINPLIVDENGAVAVDARIVVNYYDPPPDRYAHMAIYPYPTQLVTQWQLPDGTDITIRPIRPQDADIEQEFVRHLSDETRYFRFMQTMHELTPAMLVRFTQIDYEREMALIAVTEQNDKEIEIGVCRYAINPDGESCEFAVVISDQWQHRGLAHKLMICLMDAARKKGLKVIQGEVLSNNHNMIKLMKNLGFHTVLHKDDPGLTLVDRNL